VPDRLSSVLAHERRSDGEIGAAVTVEVSSARDVPSERARILRRHECPQHAARLPAQQIDATAVGGWGTDEEIDVPVAVVVSGQCQIPSEILALGFLALPELLARAGRARHHGAQKPSPDQRVRCRDDDVGEAVARDVRHQHDQWPKRPSCRSPSQLRIGRPLAPDHTVALPLWNVSWSLNRAPAATSARPSPSTSRGSPKRKPSSPRGTSPGNRRARHQPGPGVEQGAA
jgi:hypothetical protein